MKINQEMIHHRQVHQFHRYPDCVFPFFPDSTCKERVSMGSIDRIYRSILPNFPLSFAFLHAASDRHPSLTITQHVPWRATQSRKGCKIFSPTLTPFLFSLLPIISSTLPLSFHPSFLLVSSYFPLIKKYHEKHALQIRLFISNTYQKSTYHVSKSKKKKGKEKEKRLIYPTVPFQRNPPRRSLFEFIDEIQAAARSKVEPFAPLEIAAGRGGGGDSKSIGGITRRDQSMVEPLSPPLLSRGVKKHVPTMEG